MEYVGGQGGSTPLPTPAVLPLQPDEKWRRRRREESIEWTGTDGRVVSKTEFITWEGMRHPEPAG